MKRLLALSLVLVSLVALSGCAASTTQTGLVVTGQSLIGLGNTFVAVAQTYRTNCPQAVNGTPLEKFCSGFRAFAPKFQQYYPAAVDAWNIARKGNDASKANDAAAVVLQLSTDLTALALEYATATQGGK